ncbi:uncharacterized protein LOC131316119 [Rhododendron vialii]|uniref:uncharacterized protein LOC131316119 n=1 Tax=Rhododendron vialii TaxID=182163 RepID=UPI0026603288|nr:uncharacterized protein LOC131316119 [Rhododendron vialii]XP_058201382.1 uncharacterized protein LOC131316119 [Rhododendron vialii]
MDHMPPREKDFVVDLESGGTTYAEVGSTDPGLGAKVSKTFGKICTGFGSVVDGSFTSEKGISVENLKSLIDKNVEVDRAMDPVETTPEKERRKSTSGKKKPPRPPRPPKSLSLDAFDQKLIKEISEIARVKRARIERMKGLKKMKGAKESTSTGNLLAAIFAVLFCLVIIFQGMCPGRSSSITFEGSPESARATPFGFISLHFRKNTPTVSSSRSSSLVQQVSDSVTGGKVRRAAKFKQQLRGN